MKGDATATPGTIDVRVAIPTPTVLMRPHLWYTWAMVAVRQEHRAWRLRSAGVHQQNFAPYLVQEAHEAMQAVVAARHSLHNLSRVWKPILGVSEGHLRPSHFTTAKASDDFEDRLLRLVYDRNGVVHHDEETAPTQPHPQYPTNVSALEASFTAERASEAIDVMLNEVLRLAITHPSAALQAWAADIAHVVVDLDQRRVSGDDLL